MLPAETASVQATKGCHSDEDSDYWSLWNLGPQALWLRADKGEGIRVGAGIPKQGTRKPES